MSISRQGLSAIVCKKPSDVVIISALRTPIGRSSGPKSLSKSKPGGLYKHIYPEELLSHVLIATRQNLQRAGLQPSIVQDIILGTTLMELGGAKSGRLAALHAGFPYQTTFRTVNRLCSSSLQSVTDLAASIDSGAIECGIAAGTESMSRNYAATKGIPTDLSPELSKSPVEHARDCLLPMGLTSEAVAETYNITRLDQDRFALSSHLKAQAALEAGRFQDEITPVEVDDHFENEEEADSYKPKKIVVSQDEGIRVGLTLEQLSRLKPAFKPDGRSTAGNSSQISDGASAVTLIRRSAADRLGIKPLGKFVGSNVVGVPPRLMGVGPAFSTPVLLKRFGLATKDIDIFELNEAFASQVLMTIEHLNLDVDKVNPKGGAIAIGHPLGATGGRLVCSLLHELRRTGKELGVATLCCGTGFGKSSLFVAE